MASKRSEPSETRAQAGEEHRKRPRLSRKKKTLYAVLATALFLLLMEFGTRVAYALLTGSTLPLRYGFQDIRCYPEGTSLRRPIFFLDSTETAGRTTAGKSVEGLSGDQGGPILFTFGGSSTEGRSHSAEDSSWPDELARISPELRVVNFGLSGTNSDYALLALADAASRRKPDVVILAEWANELDVAYEGPQRNRKRLAERFGDLLDSHAWDYRYNQGTKHYLRFGRTLQDYSLAFRMGYEAYRLHMAGEAGFDRFEIRDGDLEMAIANTLLNFADAHALAKEHGFRLLILELPYRLIDGKDPEYNRRIRNWDSKLRSEIRSFEAERPEVRVLRVHSWLWEKEGPAAERYFYDSTHMNRQGHEVVAGRIRELLNELGIR